MAGLFITGTNTEVGKTYVTAMIAKSLVTAGHRVGVYKPVASGCVEIDGQLLAEDAKQLWDAAGQPGEFARVCPQSFKLPLAPPQAAKAEGRQVDRELLRNGINYWKDRSDIVLVEGAGGLMSPLSEEDYNADLARDLGLPLLIVAANELGTINATLQTLITARTVAANLSIAGVVLSQTAEVSEDCSTRTNGEEIAARCEVPLLATIEFGQQEFSSDIDWFSLVKS